MLPVDFRWTKRHQYDSRETAVALEGRQVAFLLERNDGGWVARLWVHRGMAAPLVLRDCTSFEAGRAGIEAWALRHQQTLRQEAGNGAQPLSTS